MPDKTTKERQLEQANHNIRESAWFLLEKVFCNSEGCCCDELCDMCAAGLQLQLSLQDWEKLNGMQ